MRVRASSMCSMRCSRWVKEYVDSAWLNTSKDSTSSISASWKLGSWICPALGLGLGLQVQLGHVGHLFPFHLGTLELDLDEMGHLLMRRFGVVLEVLNEPQDPVLVIGPHFQIGTALVGGAKAHDALFEGFHAQVIEAHLLLGLGHLESLQSLRQAHGRGLEMEHESFGQIAEV